MLARKEKRSFEVNENKTELSECGVCGQNHNADLCPFHSCQYVVEDASTPSHARLTLPSNLEVKDLPDGSTTVITRTKFTRGTRFGPFQAEHTTILPTEVNFPLKIFGSTDEDSFYLDTRDENKCNWMCLVAPVSLSNDAQNLICYQVRSELFFSSLCDIEPGEELRVWYAPFYAIKMGASPGKIPNPSGSQAGGIKEKKIKEETITWEADTTTGDVPSSAYAMPGIPCGRSKNNGPCPKEKGNEEEEQEDKEKEENNVQLKKEMLEKEVTSYVAHQLPPSRLGARFCPPWWRCRECGVKEVSVISYARHLMQHLRSPKARAKKFPCSLCHKKFYTQELLDDHEESRHGIYNLLPPLPPPAEVGSQKESSHTEPQMVQQNIHEKTTETSLPQMESLREKMEKPMMSLPGEDCSKKSEVVLSSRCGTSEIPITLNTTSESSTQCSKIFSQEQPTLDPCISDNKGLNLEILPRHSDADSKNCDQILSMTPNFEGESQLNGESNHTLVAVMGPNGLNYLEIPVDQGKNSSPLLPDIQEPLQDKSLICPSGVPETTLNHEFFTCVAGDTVKDVKSLLSKGYSLQFLVADEDGFSSLVDVLSTANGAPDQVTSSTDLFQNDKVSSQQLVIMGSGEIPQSLPLALQNILPSSVPIVPSITNATPVTEMPLLTHPSVINVPNDKLNVGKDAPLSACLQPENLFLEKQDSLSSNNTPLNTLLPSTMETNICYDTVPFSDSNTDNTSLIDVHLTGKTLEKEGLDYSLGALELPMTVEDTNSSDYMLNTCTTPPPSCTKPDDLQRELNTELNTPVKLLDQCMNSSLSADVMSFNFGNESTTAPMNDLGNPIEEGKNGDCGNGLTKDFNDLIAADADSTNIVLNIQPADSTAELVKTFSATVVDFSDKSSKNESRSSVDWIDNEGFSMNANPTGVAIETSVTNVLNVNQQPSNIAFGPSAIVNFNKLSEQGLNQEVVESQSLNSFNVDTDLDGLLLTTHSGNIVSEEMTTPTVPHVILPSETEQHTVNDEPEADIEPSYISSGPPFTCDICNKSFGRSQYLYRHLRKHTGEFTCVACREVFARKETLQLHECSAQPPHSSSSSTGHLSCPFCPKRFAVKKQLTRHLAYHTGSRRRQGAFCNSSFASKESAEQQSQVCSGGRIASNKEQVMPNQGIVNVAPFVEHTAQTSEMFRCSVCHLVFPSQTSLQCHEKTQHAECQQEETCAHCGRTLTFASLERKEQHISVCAPAAALQAGTADSAVCPKCDEPFRQLVMYRQHIYRHIYPFVCAHCRRGFASLQERGKHICLGVWEQCLECESKFVTVTQLEKHALSHGVPGHHCFECGRSFHKTDDFRQHRCFELNAEVPCKTGKRTGDSNGSSSSLSPRHRKPIRRKRIHTGASPMCEVCGEVFKSATSLITHQLLHNERKFECGICKKRFHRKDVLAEHLYVHQDAQFRCNLCNKLLKSKKTFDVHMRHHTGKKKFACHQCGKEFHQKVNFQKHMGRHGPLPKSVSCPHCSRKFQLQENLAKHILEHTECPLFSCTICNHSFVKEYMLRRHMETHSSAGVLCPICGHTVKYRSSLRRHFLKLHPELAAEKKMTSDETSDCGALSPEILLTVSQLQLTTDGVQQLSLAEHTVLEGFSLLEQETLNGSDDMVLYVLQEPLSCLPFQESSNEIV